MQNVSSTENTQSFAASRWTKGNRIFRTRISVSPVQVIKTKRSWFSSDEESINIRHISSVRIKTGVLWSDIWIESSGGTNQIYSHGHTKRDAQRIKQIVEDHQRTFKEGAFSDSAGTRKCPHCAETIKADAKICRFCNRQL
jgi:uncharacterized protein (UPF0210 family)